MRRLRALRRLWFLAFRLERAEFYRDLAEMYCRHESMVGFLEGEIANAIRTRQHAREVALRTMLDRYLSGHEAGRIRHLLEGIVPKGDAMMLLGVDRADDKVRALRSLAQAVDNQRRMATLVAAYAVFPVLMLPLCYVLIRVLSNVIVSIDRSTPEYVKPELWTGANAWARDVAFLMQGHGLAFMALLSTVAVAAVVSLPRWRGRTRLLVEGWPVYGLYRDFQASLLFSSMAMLLSNGSTLRAALEDTAQSASAWMRWHLTRVLRSLDDNPSRTIEAFSRGVLSPYMLARAATLERTAASFSDVLVELGTREIDRVVVGVKRAAVVANVTVVGLLLGLCTFMGLSTLTVPGKFSALMEPATLMSLKQAHEARQNRGGSRVPL